MNFTFLNFLVTRKSYSWDILQLIGNLKSNTSLKHEFSNPKFKRVFSALVAKLYKHSPIHLSMHTISSLIGKVSAKQEHWWKSLDENFMVSYSKLSKAIAINTTCNVLVCSYLCYWSAFINWYKNFVKKSFKVVSKYAVHHKSFKRWN